MELLLLVVASYLLGSIPFSQIFPKLKGKDVQEKGTKNVGATNALVVAGPIMGVLALVGDVAKGFLAVALANYFFQPLPWPPVLAGLAAILGHDFSIFLKFKGGKGVATTGGTLLAMDPIFAGIVLLIWILLILVTRYFIPSTLIILGGLPLMMWTLNKRIEFITFALMVFVLALYTHREDMRRLLTGKELTTSDSIRHYMNK